MVFLCALINTNTSHSGPRDSQMFLGEHQCVVTRRCFLFILELKLFSKFQKTSVPDPVGLLPSNEERLLFVSGHPSFVSGHASLSFTVSVILTPVRGGIKYTKIIFIFWTGDLQKPEWGSWCCRPCCMFSLFLFKNSLFLKMYSFHVPTVSLMPRPQHCLVLTIVSISHQCFSQMSRTPDV